MIKSLLCIVLFALPFAAQAQTLGQDDANHVTLIQLDKSTDANALSWLGLTLDDNRNLTGLFYHASSNNSEKDFSIAQLANPTTVVSVLIFRVVQISLSGNQITAYFHQNVKTSDWFSNNFTFTCDTGYQNCKTVDDTTGQTITHATIFQTSSGVDHIITE